MKRATFKRGFLSTGLLLMGLVVLLGALGLAYALWSKTLNINGTVNTGTVDAVFQAAFTDDDDVLNDPAKDGSPDGIAPGDDDSCTDLGGVDQDADGLTSCDPSGFGPNPPRYDKDVARCDADIDPADPTNETLLVTVTNGYPSYHCTVWYDIHNTGTIPVKIQSLTVTNTSPDITVSLSGVSCGLQIDPSDTAQGDLHVHVEQSAAQGATYSFSAQMELVQWNEFDQNLCP